MSAPPRRPFLLSDAMTLVVAAAVTLFLIRAVGPTLWGRTSHGDLPGWLTDFVLDAARGSLLAVPVLLVWTLSLGVLHAFPRRVRPRFQKALTSPGAVACGVALPVAACVGIQLLVVCLTLMFLDGRVWGVEDWYEAGVEFLQLNDAAVVCAPGVAVAVAWALSATCGRWRPRGDWLDRAGTSAGVAWVALAASQPWATLVLARTLF